jgi:energy-coupling factor transporter transmembrane protein EcfT
MSSQGSWITSVFRGIGEAIKHEKVLSALSVVFVVSFSAGVAALKLPDFTKAREFFAISALSAWLIILLSVARSALARRWKIVWSVVSFLAASTFYFWLWYWVRELEAKETHTSADIPGIPQWLMRSIAYAHGMPWLWILAGFAIGVIAMALVCSAIRKRRRVIESTKPSVTILTPLDTWRVGSRTTIRGSIYPPESGKVQVLVHPVNDGWYLQPDALVRGGSWALNYHFGKRGFSYEIVAVYGGSLRIAKYGELDPSWIKSEIIKVHRDRDDDDIDCHDKRLHQTKIDDRSAIKELVKVCFVRCEPHINVKDEEQQYVDFRFCILNLSLFPVSVESISGGITFLKENSSDAMSLDWELKLLDKVLALPFRADRCFMLRQFLAPQDVAPVDSGSDRSTFYLYNLNIMITGEGFESVRLDVPAQVQKGKPWIASGECEFVFASIAEAEAKIRDLEAPNESELDRLSHEAVDPTEKP